MIDKQKIEDLVHEGKHFCILPWVHFHAWPDKRVMPCCVADSNMPVAQIESDQSIIEMMNSDGFKEIRRKMLNDEAVEACTRCYDLELMGTWTMRQSHNRRRGLEYRDYIAENTQEDGALSEFEMKYMDIRFSNLCNMKCRSCGPDCSSQWAQEFVDKRGKEMFEQYFPNRKVVINNNDDQQFMVKLKPYLADVTEVYFAGGESLMTEEHYRILDYWISIGKTDVQLNYTTNFTKLDYKQRNLFELWKQFPNLRVAASLDGMGERGEYIRKNMIWKEVVNNRKRMMQELPDAYFEITPTVSMWNAKHLPDFHRDWVQHGYVDINNIRINQLTSPRYFSTRILPETIKQKITDKITKHCVWLSENNANDNTIKAFEGIISFMNETNDSDLLHLWAHQTAKLDKIG